MQKLHEQPRRLFEVIQSGIGTQPAGSYLHWDELRHRSPLPGFNHEEWWLATKLARQSGLRSLPFRDKAARPFTYGTPDPVQALLHEVDRNAAGHIQIPELVTDEVEGTADLALGVESRVARVPVGAGSEPVVVFARVVPVSPGETSATESAPQ